VGGGWWVLGCGQVESGFSGGKAPQVHAEKRRKATSSIQKAERSEFPISANGATPFSSSVKLEETRENRVGKRRKSGAKL